MNRIVREHYPAAKLPEDLREGFAADADVRVVIEVQPRTGTKKPFDLQELFDRARPSFRNADEVADHIRAMREEWD